MAGDPKLSMIIAVEKGMKQRANKSLGEAHKYLQKTELFLGLQRDYKPLDEEDNEKLPSEQKKIIARTDELMESIASQFAELWNVTATKDIGNTSDTANIEVNGEILMENAPVPFLLFMEKQLLDLKKIVSDLPTLDPAEEWEYDNGVDAYRSKVTQTHRTKKVPKSQVLYEATPEHPAQVQVFTEDVVVGIWSRTVFSSAIQATQKRQTLSRVEELYDAVKKAREEANTKTVTQQKIAAPLLNWALEPLKVQIED